MIGGKCETKGRAVVRRGAVAARLYVCTLRYDSVRGWLAGGGAAAQAQCARVWPAR